MQRQSLGPNGLLIGLGVIVAVAACNPASDTPPVVFGSAAPVGSWQAEAGSSEAPAAGSGYVDPPTFPNAGSASDGPIVPPRAGSTGAAGMVIAAAGRGAAGSAAGSGGTAPTAGSGGTAPTAGSGGASVSGAGGLTSLAFGVTTSAVGYRYQPKNIGAIWVQDKNGKLVKSLEVWAGIRRRWLTRYASALAGAAVDVTASATLPNHRAHQVTWNLKDKTGAPVPAGAYTLVMELTDGDQTGRSNLVPFDLSAGAQTLTPATAPSFNSMTLQLH